jgi:hypothetical protein
MGSDVGAPPDEAMRLSAAAGWLLKADPVAARCLSWTRRGCGGTGSRRVHGVRRMPVSERWHAA